MWLWGNPHHKNLKEWNASWGIWIPTHSWPTLCSLSSCSTSHTTLLRHQKLKNSSFMLLQLKSWLVSFFFCYYYFFKSSSQLLGQPHIALPYQFPLTLLSASEWLMLVRQLTLCESMFSQEAKEVFPHVHGIMSLFISKPSGFLPYPDTKLKSVSVLTSTLIWLSITTTEILYLPTAHTCSPSSGVFVFCFPSLQATLPAIKFSLSRVYY